MLISGFVIGSFIRKNVPKEKQRMLEEGYNYEYDHMKRMINCLKKPEFNINVNDERQLDKLIERAKKERDTHGVWKTSEFSLFKLIKKPILDIIVLVKNIFLQLFSNWSILECLSKFIKNGYWQKILSIGIISLCDFLLIYVIFSLFRGFLCDFVIPSKKRHLDSFISDVEDIKLFPNKACSIIKDEEKRIKRKRKHQGKKIIKVLKSRFAGNTASERCEPDGPCVPEYEINVRKRRGRNDWRSTGGWA